VKALAVKKATTTVPLIMVAVGDPVGTGLVPSLARPGGNLTGLSSIAPDLEGKRLQLLREIVPALSHVAMFVNSLNPFHVSSMRQARAAAQAMGIKLQLHDDTKIRRPRRRFCCNPKGTARCATHPGGGGF
jgi:putative ABC transport system substrate-binding protein